MDYVEGTCQASCNAKNGKFFDGVQCRDCPVGCKECVSATVCRVCDSSKNYVLQADYTCSLCPTSNKKFMNTENYPPTCDSCESGCLECSDKKTCTKCDATQGFYLSSGDCLTCDLSNGKFIPSSGDSCQDCNIANCLECSDASTCTRCDPNGLHYVVNGACQTCPINNKKFYNTANTPPTCDSCGSNCLKCSDANTCTFCDPNGFFYIVNGQCQACTVGNKKFLNTANTPPTCDPCGNNCLECSDGNTCTRCDPKSFHYLVNGECKACEVQEGQYLNLNNTPPTCDACQSNCLECSDRNTCTKCNQIEGIYLKSGKCLNCDISKGKYITSSTPHVCKDCSPNCLTCSQSTENSGTCLTYKKKPRCGEKCLVCSGTTENQCQTCLSGFCQSIRGNCVDCPQGLHQPSDSNSVVENSALTFSFEQVSLNNLEDYKLTFSEQEIVFDGIDLYDLKKHMKVKIMKKLKILTFLG